MPRPRQPDLIRMEYYKAMLPFVQVAKRALMHYWSNIARAVQAEYSKTEKRDESPSEYIRRLIQEASARATQFFDQKAAAEAVERYATRTDDFNKEQLGRQVGAALGVSLQDIERPIVDKLPAFVQENVDLIKTVHDRYFERIERDALRALEQGWTAAELAEKIEDDYGASESDAMRIARDQIGKLNAQLNEERLGALGVEEYIWRTMNDNRVRDEHEELEGQRFSFDDPPPEGNPGTAIQCRCYAEPVFEGMGDQ